MAKGECFPCPNWSRGVIVDSGETTKRDHDERLHNAAPLAPDRWLDEHGDMLFRFAKARVGRSDVAEDLVQETLLAALRGQQQFRGEADERTWLLAILKRKVVEFWEVFSDCLGKLPQRMAGVFSQREIDQLPAEEVCKELAITPTNLWVLLYRSRLRLWKCLDANWFGGERAK
jgi:DNA-directed RNA polymerase specialized sigma24 family protein